MENYVYTEHGVNKTIFETETRIYAPRKHRGRIAHASEDMLAQGCNTSVLVGLNISYSLCDWLFSNTCLKRASDRMTYFRVITQANL